MAISLLSKTIIHKSYGNYNAHIGISENKSDFGLRGGYITSLSIWYDGNPVCMFSDSIWSIEPVNEEVRKIMIQICDQYN